jgi:membrane protease YdiL (CAAX protease family)
MIPARRAAEGIAYIGAWALLGLIFKLDANQYLLIGIPLTLIFQKYVRRQPIRALWVRQAPRFQLDKTGWLIALALAVIPGRACADALMQKDYTVAAWSLAAVAGAVVAAYALRNFTQKTARSLLFCLAVAGTIGIALMSGTALIRHSLLGTPLHFKFKAFGYSLLSYFPVCFILEEVSFRGALDAHLHHEGQPRQWASALLVSALWGLWHLPIVPHDNLLAVAGFLLIVHCAVGVPLSFYWRKSGNLAVTGFTHALIDAVRNALLT